MGWLWSGGILCKKPGSTEAADAGTHNGDPLALVHRDLLSGNCELL